MRRFTRYVLIGSPLQIGFELTGTQGVSSPSFTWIWAKREPPLCPCPHLPPARLLRFQPLARRTDGSVLCRSLPRVDTNLTRNPTRRLRRDVLRDHLPPNRLLLLRRLHLHLPQHPLTLPRPPLPHLPHHTLPPSHAQTRSPNHSQKERPNPKRRKAERGEGGSGVL